MDKLPILRVSSDKAFLDNIIYQVVLMPKGYLVANIRVRDQAANTMRGEYAYTDLMIIEGPE